MVRFLLGLSRVYLCRAYHAFISVVRISWCSLFIVRCSLASDAWCMVHSMVHGTVASDIYMWYKVVLLYSGAVSAGA